MQSRQVAVRPDIGHLSKNKDSANRQIILVLLGLCVAFFQLVIFFAAESNFLQMPGRSATNPPDITYQTDKEGGALYFVSRQRETNTVSLQALSCSLPADIAPLFFKPIPLNHASINLLCTIPGIGPHLAEEIHEYISKHGPLTNVSDLKRVKGIGVKKSKQIALYAGI